MSRLRPKVESIVNPETGEKEVYINDRPLAEFDFSYNAFIGDIGLKDYLLDLFDQIKRVFRTPKKKK